MYKLAAVMLFAAIVLLSGCLNMSEMSANQLRATNGLAACTQATTMYGKGSSIVVNADDIRKGVSAHGKTVIVCGDATMTMESTQK